MRFLIVSFVLISLISCENKFAQDILGTWQCIDVSEEGNSLDLDVSVINFSFDENRGYTYQGTLAYKEAGSYRLVGDKLYTTDTVDVNAVEKVVKITLLEGDSMKFKMNDGGKERIMSLVRK